MKQLLLIAFALTSTCAAAQSGFQASASEESEPVVNSKQIKEKYFSISGELGVGYYGAWPHKGTAIHREWFGEHFLNVANPIGTSARVALARHVRDGALIWGVAYYHWSSSLRLDTTYYTTDGTYPLVVFDGHKVRDGGNSFNAFVEPRLLQRGRFQLYGHATFGIVYLADDHIVFPLDGGTVRLVTSRADNSGFVEFHGALGMAARYRLNPYYGIYGGLRYNTEVSAGFFQELAEASVGIELDLRRRVDR